MIDRDRLDEAARLARDYQQTRGYASAQMAAHVAATRLGLPVARVLDRLLTLYAEERERARERARSPLMYSPLVPLGMWPGAPSGPPRLGYAQPPPEPQPARLAKIIPFPTSTPTMHGPA